MKRALRFACNASLVMALVAGCKEKRAERVAESYSTATKPSDPLSAPPRPRPGPRAPEKVAVGIDSVPVEESYEEHAAASISDANLRAKLTELEKELSP